MKPFGHRLAKSVVMLLVLAAAGCRPEGTSQVKDEQLRVEPSRVEFEPTFIGATRQLTVVVTNPARASHAVTPSIASPFAVPSGEISVGGGDSVDLSLSFAPSAAGPFTSQLKLGETTVEVSGVGLEPLSCDPSTECVEIVFDPQAGTCVSTVAAESTACETDCILGQCFAGECVGTFKNCPDTACTIGVCSETTGCSHVPRVCPAAPGPCQEAVCDNASGCGFADKIDGSLCGPDDCRSGTVDVCIGGACQTRNRPATGRCTNTWIPLNASPHSASIAWDPTTHETLMLGSTERSTNTTWGWNGARWVLHLPPASPPDRESYAMVTNTKRNTVLLFGGQGFNDTWEWNGTTWLEYHPSLSPSARINFAMAFDELRGRAVLFGGLGAGYLDDMWEWDGHTWIELQPAHRPPARGYHAMAWDPQHQRVLLFGGTNDPQYRSSFSDTWSWDGTDWVQLPTNSIASRSFHGMTWDPISNVMLAFGGYNGDSSLDSTISFDGTSWTTRNTPQGPQFNRGPILATDHQRNRAVMVNAGVWEWDGTTWVSVSPGPMFASRLFFDAQRGSTTAIGYGATWAWDAGSWSDTGITTSTELYPVVGSVWDPQRQRGVAISTQWQDGGTITWEIENQTWTPRSAAGPSLNNSVDVPMVWDGERQRVVVFGGSTGAITWEWDGGSWEPFTQDAGPLNRISSAMAWDSSRQRTVLFGGVSASQRLNDTWERDGSGWTRLTDGPAMFSTSGAAFDPVRHRTVLLGSALSTGEQQTWEWDGTTWTLLSLGVVPSRSSYDGQLLYDGAQQRIVLLRDAVLWKLEP
jgi:hypothetical protein